MEMEALLVSDDPFEKCGWKVMNRFSLMSATSDNGGKAIAGIGPETFTRLTDLSYVHILQMLYMC